MTTNCPTCALIVKFVSTPRGNICPACKSVFNHVFKKGASQAKRRRLTRRGGK